MSSSSRTTELPMSEPVSSDAGSRFRGLAASLALLGLLGLIWGSVPNLGKYVGQAGMRPMMYAVYTVAIGALLLSLLNLVRRQSIQLSARHLAFYAISGVLSTGLPLAIMFTVVKHIPAGIMSILMAFIPLLAYAIVLVLRQEAFNGIRLSGILLGFAGASLILVSQTGLSKGISPIWVVIGFLTPLCYAAGNVYNHRSRPADTDALVAANGMLICAALFLSVLVLLTGGFESLAGYSTTVVAVTVLHGFLSAVAFTVFFGLLKIAGPVYVSQVAYLVALFGIALGMMIFGERFDIWFWVAVALICAGLWLVNKTSAKAPA